MSQQEPNWRAPGALILAGAVAAALAWTTVSGTAMRPLLGWIHVPYGRALATNLTDLAVMGLAIMAAARIGPARLFGLTGLAAPVARPLLWAALLFAPAFAIAAALAPVSPELTGRDLFWKGGAFPVFEEVVYRGLAVGALIRLAGWRWWAACLAPAVAFGLVHAGQGADGQSIAGIVAITGLGGLLFGWLFVRWGFDLWPAILLHIGMNSLWMVFALGEDALGGWLGNGLRLAIVAGAILATLWLARRPAAEAYPPARGSTLSSL